MRIIFHAVYASRRGCPELHKVLRLQKFHPAQRRQFDFFTGIGLSPTRNLASSGTNNFYRRKSEKRLVPMGEEHTGKRGGFTLLTQLFAASLSWFFPVFQIWKIETNR